MYMNRTQHLQRPSALEQQPECRRPMTGNAPRKSRKAGAASDVIGYPITSLAAPVPISRFLCGVLHGVISFIPRPFRRCVWRGSRPRPLQSSVDSARAGLDTRGLGNEKAPRKNRGAFSFFMPIEIENAKGRCPKTPAQRLTGDAFRGTPPVSAISPKKSLRTALKMGRS